MNSQAARLPGGSFLALLLIACAFLVAPFTAHAPYWPLHAGCVLLLATVGVGLRGRTVSLPRTLCLLVASSLMAVGVARIVVEDSRVAMLGGELRRMQSHRAILPPGNPNDVASLIRRPTFEELSAVARARGAGWGRAAVDALAMLDDPAAESCREGGEIIYVCGFSAPRWLPFDPARAEWLRAKLRDERRRGELAEAARARLMVRLAAREYARQGQPTEAGHDTSVRSRSALDRLWGTGSAGRAQVPSR